MTTRVGFIGLGAIGEGMARNIVAAGYPTRGFDILSEPLDRFEAAGGERADSARACAKDVDVLLVTVFTASQADHVLFGDAGALESLPKGAVVCMHTTMSPQQSRALHDRLAAAGHRFLDAPVTGGKSGADAGTLTIIVSGDPSTLERVRPVLQAMSAKIAFCGEAAGAASTVKMANQLLCGIHVVAAAEALALATKAGADPNIVFDVIRSGAANSFVWETRVPTILAGDFEPRGVVDIFKKDLGIVLEAGREMEFPLPMTAAALQQFLAAASMGYLRHCDSAVVKVYEQLANVDIAAAANRGSNIDDPKP